MSFINKKSLILIYILLQNLVFLHAQTKIDPIKKEKFDSALNVYILDIVSFPKISVIYNYSL